MVRIYVKGAPEYILPNCNSAINSEGLITALDDSLKMKLLDDTISKIAFAGNKPLTYAFKDINLQDLNDLM